MKSAIGMMPRNVARESKHCQITINLCVLCIGDEPNPSVDGLVYMVDLIVYNGTWSTVNRVLTEYVLKVRIKCLEMTPGRTVNSMEIRHIYFSQAPLRLNIYFKAHTKIWQILLWSNRPTMNHSDEHCLLNSIKYHLKVLEGLVYWFD